EAARAPLGYTYTMTGTFELRSDVTMSSIEVEMPPGVFSTSRNALDPSDWARDTSLATYAAVMLLMSPLRSALRTCGAAASDGRGSKASTAANASATRTIRTPRLFDGWM